MPILDSQNIGEAVENGSILDMTDFVKENIDTSQYDPYFLAACGQYRRRRPARPTRRQDLRAAAARRHVVDDLAQGPDGRHAARHVGGHDRRGQEVPGREPGMSGLAFHQAGTGDAAAVTYNVMNALYGGELWNQDDRKIEGVINDAAGKKAMDVLVNEMVPLAPKGSSNWFIDEVNAAISQGKVCVGFQWIAAMGGLLDPKSSKLGKTKEEILEKLASRRCRRRRPTRCRSAAWACTSRATSRGEAGRGAELHQVVPDARGPEEVGAARRRPGAQRRAAVARVPRGPAVQPGVHGLRAALKDFWNLPEYAKLLNVHSTQVNAAISGTEEPDAALDKLASEEQAILDESGVGHSRGAGPGPRPPLLRPDTWRHAPIPPRPAAANGSSRRLRRRYRFLTDRRLAFLFISPALALLSCRSGR